MLSKARIMYTSLVKQGDWNFSAEESSTSIFQARDAQDNRNWNTTSFNCGQKGHIKPNCPKLQTGNGSQGGGGRKETNPWYVRPSSQSGDTCKMVGQNKCWEKQIKGINAAWCGRCVSKTTGKAGMWTGPPRRHFTFECSNPGDAANLCQETNPDQAESEGAANASPSTTDDRTFSEALAGYRAAAEGGD